MSEEAVCALEPRPRPPSWSHLLFLTALLHLHLAPLLFSKQAAQASASGFYTCSYSNIQLIHSFLTFKP